MGLLGNYMELALDQESITMIVGITVLMLVHWAVFRNKSIAFRKKYHPRMTYIGVIGFGFLIILVPFKEAPLLIKIIIVVFTVMVAFIDVKKRQICDHCGNEANEFAINGLFKSFKFCPQCGESYDQSEASNN